MTAGLLVVFYTVGLTMYEPFSSLRFVVDLIKGNAALGICAVGMTLVIISGGIDLSVGSVMALATVIIATLLDAGYGPLTAMAAALVAGAIVGFANGFVVNEFRLPAFLVTLASMFFARGLAFWINPQPTSIENDLLNWLMDEVGFSLSLPGMGEAWVPVTAFIFLTTLAIGWVASRWTRFGRYAFAIGGNPQSAVLMGVPVKRTTIGLYALSGLCAGLAGITTTLIDSAGKPNIGAGLELEAIAAVVIGGTLLTGGVGTLGGTLMGVLIIGMVRAVINLDGRLPSPWHHISIGVLLLLFITVQRVLVLRAAQKSNA
jgi:simple sugar transport system permease protein